MSFRTAAIIVFLGSFCLMVLEIVAGRMIAPYLGSSLYSWTSVIGVILTGITVGNALGGVVADRHASRMLLGKVFFLAAAMTAIIPLLARGFGTFLGQSIIPLPLATLLFSLALFFPASFFLSFISPIAIKLVLTTLDATGRVVGRIYAASAFGSILGTFATGFIFIAYIGTIRIVWVIAIFLFFLSFFLWRESVWRGKRGALLLSLIVAAAIFFPGPCTRESQYYCIGILSFHEEGKDGYIFRLDHLTHSFVFLDDPSYLKYDYEKASSWFIEYASRERGPLSILFLGGGGYTLPRYLAAFYPEHRVTVVEIDPEVTEANYVYLGLPRTTPITTINDDARRYLQRLPDNQKFDVIIGDAFNDFSVPFHLTTREFDTLVERHLTPHGFYLANNIDDVRFGRFLASRLATFRVTFPFASFAPLVPSWEGGGRNTFLVVGAYAPFDEDALRQSVPRGRELQEEKERTILSLLSQNARDDFVQKRRGIVLTDEYAPVDNFLAAVFRAGR